MSMRLLSPAKINLHLRVAPPTRDGFHPLLSWMTTIGLFDTLTFDRAGDGNPPPVTMTCDDPSLACDETNLVVRAARAVLPDRGAGVRIALEKRIPMGGGLGGGSSNAAATLVGVDRRLDLKRSPAELSEAAARLGSDVTFFLHGPSSVCQGRGEIVSPIARLRPSWVVLILPGIAMPTPLVYRTFDQMKLGDTDRIDRQPDWKMWTTLAANDLLPRLINDLEAPAFAIRPELSELRASVEKIAGRIVRMSGSGSSLFTLCDEESEADAIADRVMKQLNVRCVPCGLAPAATNESVG